MQKHLRMFDFPKALCDLAFQLQKRLWQQLVFGETSVVSTPGSPSWRHVEDVMAVEDAIGAEEELYGHLCDEATDHR